MDAGTSRNPGIPTSVFHTCFPVHRKRGGRSYAWRRTGRGGANEKKKKRDRGWKEADVAGRAEYGWGTTAFSLSKPPLILLASEVGTTATSGQQHHHQPPSSSYLTTSFYVSLASSSEAPRLLAAAQDKCPREILTA
ncbi:hypothetical protein KM043_015541 [Ampulex compressa]|nr:hypothetical protein KM043_015541 [Ampulex compressa]